MLKFVKNAASRGILTNLEAWHEKGEKHNDTSNKFFSNDFHVLHIRLGCSTKPQLLRNNFNYFVNEVPSLLACSF